MTFSESLSNRHVRFILAFLIILLSGGALRLLQLARRPLHTDEAVHAIKFGALLEKNEYHYDPVEYHGPTLNYFTLPFVWLAGEKTLPETNESLLRMVPAAFGLLLIVLCLVLKPAWPGAVLWAALFTAVSPVMVFYSRYYIQEMLLAAMSFGALSSGYRCFKTKKWLWAIGCGLFLGLMHATKETSIIVYGSLFAAFLLTMLIRKREKNITSPAPRNYFLIPVSLLTALAVSALFYSSFLKHPRGIVDSFLTYGIYFSRAGDGGIHTHPFFEYFTWLFRHRPGSYWGEAGLAVLAIPGFVAAFTSFFPVPGDRRLIRFIAFYTLIMTVVYSAIPYKTPWSMLGFYTGIIWMAAFGTAFLISLRKGFWRTAVLVLIAACVAHLAFQSWLLNFRFESDPSNPYVYGHTSKDIFSVVSRVEEAAAVHPDGKELHVQVVCPGHDYWPLPWYLRSFPNTGWWEHVNSSIAPAPVILASASAEPEIVRMVYEYPPPGEKYLYVPLMDGYTELRPGVEIRGYIRNDLRDRLPSRNLP